MKSVKPGRAPSMMGGVMSIVVGCFGVVWTIGALSIGGGAFALFGVIFIIVAVVQAVYHFRNATAKERFSSFDIVDSAEEGDPLARHFAAEQDESAPAPSSGSDFCPFCGQPASFEFKFCNKCGKELP